MFHVKSEYKINNQIVLNECIDDNYEPTQEEIHEYAIYIGIDPEKEPELLWLAKEGFMKPLPSGWKACKEENGELYYFNFNTGKSSWEHPCDEVFKLRVIREREKKFSSATLLDTHSKGKNTSSLSDLSTGVNPYNLPTNAKNETLDNQIDSQYSKSGSEEELIHSDNDDEQDSNDFRQNLNFGIDRKLSARIQRDENQFIAIDNTTKSVEGDPIQHESLAAHADDRRLRANKVLNSAVVSNTSEDIEIIELRRRLEKSTDDEKLQLFEDNRIYIDNLKKELLLERTEEEKRLRDTMKSELLAIENTLKENLAREKKRVETQQINDLNHMKQAFEKEKHDLQDKLRADMLADLNIEQQTNIDIQMRLLQMKNEYEEKIRQIEYQYKGELEDTKLLYHQMKNERDAMENRLQEKQSYCATLQRTIDQLHSEKSSIERKLHDTNIELQALESSNRHTKSYFNRQLSTNSIKDDSSNIEQSLSTFQTNIQENIDDGDDLSDTDSDVIQMKHALNELRHISLNAANITTTTTTNDNNSHNKQFQSTTPNLASLQMYGANSLLGNMTFESTFADSGKWSNTFLSTMNSSLYPLKMSNMNNQSLPKSTTNPWQSQPSLITREAVIKAARDVLPPGVIDRLTSKN